MLVKTADLEGVALNWIIAKCEGFVPFTDGISWIIEVEGKYTQLPHYSTDWAQGGPIIEREMIDLDFYKHDCEASMRGDAFTVVSGPTPLIAAMRCYVASKLGDEVEMLEELK